MSGGNPDVKCIYCGLLRERSTSNQLTGKPGGLFGNRESRNSTKCPQATSTYRQVPERGLISHDL